jgi:hypothetical protein
MFDIARGPDDDDRGQVSMQYRQLGRPGLRVFVLTLGTMGFGGTG